MMTPGIDACCSNSGGSANRQRRRQTKRGDICAGDRSDSSSAKTTSFVAPIRKFTKFSTSLMLTITAIFIFTLIDIADAQGLNDPITQYIEGRLGNRRIYWCPSGYGYLAYCPQPTDWDNYTWCCTWPYMGSWKPSCCPFALPTGAVVAIIIASIILVAVLVGLSCWCCFCCPLYKKLYEYEDDDDFEPLPPSQQQQRPYGYGPQ